MGSNVIDNYDGPQLIYDSYVMHINCGMMLIVMNNIVCPPHWSSMPEATCLIMIFDARGG